MSMVFTREPRIPHGGVFVLPIPKAVANLVAYLIAIAAGAAVTAAALCFTKRPVTIKEAA